MKKLLAILIILGLVAWWYFGYYSKRSNGASTAEADLPPIRVTDASLSKAGRELLADTKRRVEALRKEPGNTKLRFAKADYIAGSLKLLGDYRSAAEWYLALIDWYEELSPADRQVPEYRDPDGIPFAAAHSASMCFFFSGENEKGYETMETYLRRYPNDPNRSLMLTLYKWAKQDLGDYLKSVSAMRAPRRYLK